MALNSRKGGMVARIRVSPKDCLAVVDVLEAAGLSPYEHSFSGCVAIALSSLIAVGRKAGIIPVEEDGFQYLNRIGPFMDQHSSLAKRERTNRLYENAQAGFDPPMPPVRMEGRVGIPLTPMGEGEKESLMEEFEGLKKLLMAVAQRGEDPPEKEMERFMFLQGKLF